jgi:hypothetical protein
VLLKKDDIGESESAYEKGKCRIMTVIRGLNCTIFFKIEIFALHIVCRKFMARLVLENARLTL